MSDDGQPVADATPLHRPWHAALAEGRLVVPQCVCGRRWLPASPECPACLQAGCWQWVAASGRGTVESWVVYHVAYHPAFKDRLPYNVALVALDEGPRLMANLLQPLDTIHIGQRVRLAPQPGTVPATVRFVPIGTSAPGHRDAP